MWQRRGNYQIIPKTHSTASTKTLRTGGFFLASEAKKCYYLTRRSLKMKGDANMEVKKYTTDKPCIIIEFTHHITKKLEAKTWSEKFLTEMKSVFMINKKATEILQTTGRDQSITTSILIKSPMDQKHFRSIEYLFLSANLENLGFID